MTHTITNRGRGRPGKGPRDSGFLTRPHVLVGQEVRERWEDEGYESMGDFVAAAVAHFVGMPEYAPEAKPRTSKSPDQGQGELPMTG